MNAPQSFRHHVQQRAMDGADRHLEDEAQADPTRIPNSPPPGGCHAFPSPGDHPWLQLRLEAVSCSPMDSVTTWPASCTNVWRRWANHAASLPADLEHAAHAFPTHFDDDNSRTAGGVMPPLARR